MFFCTQTILPELSANRIFIILCLGLAAQFVLGKTVDLNTKKIEVLSDGNLVDQLPLDTLNPAQCLTNNKKEEPQIRRSRSPSPFGTRQECTVSKDKLGKLNDEINDALERAGGTSSEQTVGCSLSSTNPDNCAELIKLIQCGISQMSVGFSRAVANEASSEEVLKWKNAYDKLSENFERDKDILEKFVSQEHQRELEGLKTQLQNFERSFRDAQRKLNEKTKVICISEMASGKIDEAISHYKSLEDSDYTKLSEIIKAVYNGYGNLDQLDNIVNFIRKLPYCEQVEVAYPVLIELLNTDHNPDHNTDHNPKTLYAIWAMEDSVCDLKGINIQVSKANLITTLAPNIRDKNYQQFKEFDKNHGSILRENLGELVRQAYANDLSNAETIIKFTRDLNWIDSSIVGLNSLFDRMKINGHLDSYQLIMLAYRVKELMEMPNYPNVGQEYKEMAESLENSKLPSNVMRLIWSGEKCTIINKEHQGNEYLYAASDTYKSLTGYRGVFTWRPGSSPDDVKEAKWDFEPKNNAENFYIKSSHYYNEYILSKTPNTYDDERRKIYTRYGTWPESYYRIEPVDNAQYFRIYNTHHKEYLYADGDWRHAYDLQRRNIFTWRKGSIPPGIQMEESKWKINC
jgi:hypothetical protein